MNCTVCGGPFVLGSDMHADCRKTERLARHEKVRLETQIGDLTRRIENLEAGFEWMLAEMGIE